MKGLKLYLYLLVIIGFVAGWQGAYLLLFSSLMGLILLMLAWLWNHYIFSKLTVKRSFSSNRVKIGDEVFYQIEVENRKFLPVMWLKIENDITDGIDFLHKGFLYKLPKNKNTFHDRVSLMWYERLKRQYQLMPEQRGVYNFYGIRLSNSGVLGIFQKSIEQLDIKSLVVLPRIVPLSRLGIKLKYPFGSRRQDGWIFKDRLNKVGVRPYQVTDDIKQINWKASARHLQLEADVFQPSLDRELHIFLNSRTENNWWEGYNKNSLELSIICAASLIETSCKSGYQVGLYSDGVQARQRNYTILRPGSGSGQREKLLTALARLRPINDQSLSSIMKLEKSMIKSGSTVVVISTYLPEELITMLNYYQRYFQTVLIKINNKNRGEMEEAKLARGIEVYYIDEEEAWDEIEIMELDH